MRASACGTLATAPFSQLATAWLLQPRAVPTPPVAASLNLGRAASFAVLAGTSITNNSGGTTLVSGDVGSPSQTVDPTQVAGYTNYKSGAILSGALADEEPGGARVWRHAQRDGAAPAMPLAFMP